MERAAVDVHAWARRNQLSLADELFESVPLKIDLDIRSVGCDDLNAAEYDGGLAVTQNGRTCQDWAGFVPSGWHSYHHLPRNYCRDPEGNGLLWCYTTDPHVRWEYCSIPTLCTLPPAPPAPPSAPDPPALPSLANEGEECWRSCYGQSGPCETGFCGAVGVCCRLGYDEHLLSCGFGTLGCDGNHCCVASAESLAAEEGQICMSTDHGALDSFGDPCAVYDAYPQFCTTSDDDDFTSTSLCCACGGGALVTAPPPAPDTAPPPAGAYVYDGWDPYAYDPTGSTYLGGTYFPTDGTYFPTDGTYFPTDGTYLPTGDTYSPPTDGTYSAPYDTYTPPWDTYTPPWATYTPP